LWTGQETQRRGRLQELAKRRIDGFKDGRRAEVANAGWARGSGDGEGDLATQVVRGRRAMMRRRSARALGCGVGGEGVARRASRQPDAGRARALGEDEAQVCEGVGLRRRGRGRGRRCRWRRVSGVACRASSVGRRASGVGVEATRASSVGRRWRGQLSRPGNAGRASGP